MAVFAYSDDLREYDGEDGNHGARRSRGQNPEQHPPHFGRVQLHHAQNRHRGVLVLQNGAVCVRPLTLQLLNSDTPEYLLIQYSFSCVSPFTYYPRHQLVNFPEWKRNYRKNQRTSSLDPAAKEAICFKLLSRRVKTSDVLPAGGSSRFQYINYNGFHLLMFPTERFFNEAKKQLKGNTYTPFLSDKII